ncbi:hypothetical protein BJX63DRAFT_417230 [Aspergillus granulosus]|uniref:Uncharacterized protein n=1 Tax=Aspergillus granulosus TaxID=176169 RepID=A0ABR4GR76_9EURO
MVLMFRILLFFLVTRHISGMNSAGINGITIWTERDCQGVPASTIFNGTTISQNISNACLSQSFKLARPLQGQEQFDISITLQPDLWRSFSVNNQSCTSFIQSYFPTNGSDDCHNTPPFTCHRLWINDGLPLELSGPVVSSASSLPSTWSSDTPSSCYTHSLIPTHNTSSHITESPTKSHETPSQTTGLNQIHTVQVKGRESASFDPISLDSIPTGHTISFQSNESFQLIRETLDDPCAPKREFKLGTELSYKINETGPVWFSACLARDMFCICNKDTHFALNPGDQFESFKAEIERPDSVTTRTGPRSWVLTTETVTVVVTATKRS